MLVEYFFDPLEFMLIFVGKDPSEIGSNYFFSIAKYI